MCPPGPLGCATEREDLGGVQNCKRILQERNSTRRDRKTKPNTQLGLLAGPVRIASRNPPGLSRGVVLPRVLDRFYEIQVFCEVSFEFYPNRWKIKRKNQLETWKSHWQHLGTKKNDFWCICDQLLDRFGTKCIQTTPKWIPNRSERQPELTQMRWLAKNGSREKSRGLGVKVPHPSGSKYLGRFWGCFFSQLESKHRSKIRPPFFDLLIEASGTFFL